MLSKKEILSRVKGKTWGRAAAQTGKCMFSTPEERWEVWVALMQRYQKVSPTQVTLSWLGSFHPDDELYTNGHRSKTMVYRALHKYPVLRKRMKELNLPVGELMGTIPLYLQRKAHKEEKPIVGTVEESAVKVVRVDPPRALFIDFLFFAKAPELKVRRKGEVKILNVGKLLRGLRDNGWVLDDVIDFLEEVG